MTDTKPGGGLQVIFAMFLGLMVSALIGVGVYTFYPSPADQLNTRIQDLSRQEQTIRNSKPANELTPTDRDQLQALTDESNRVQDELRATGAVWGRNTSIILLVFATLLMAISLVRADQLPVISQGLLLGGVFTMIYSVGWIIATNTSIARFTVMAVAFVITLALGYARFAHGRQTMPVAVVTGNAMSGAELADIEQRVAAIEKRLNDAAEALKQP